MVSCGAMVSSSQLRVCVCCGQCTQTGPVTQFDLEGNRQLFAIESVRLVCKSGAGTSILFRTMVSQHSFRECSRSGLSGTHFHHCHEACARYEERCSQMPC